MSTLSTDPLWQTYERASHTHRAAMKVRVDLDGELVRDFSGDLLRAWDEAHREEERCFEELKSAERAVRAKYANL